MKILITGNLGFIFSHVTEYFLERGNEVVGIDKLVDGSHPELIKEFENKYPNYRQYVHDLKSINEVLDEDFDVVINAAAESNVDKSLSGDEVFIDSNVTATKRLLDYCVKHKPQVFIQVSTDEVLGTTTHPADTETLLKPQNFYSACKASQEMLCHAYENTYGLPIKITRMCNIIGKRQATTKLIPRVIECLRQDKEIPVYDGGTAIREYLDVRDVAPLLEMVISSPLKTFHLTRSQSLNILEVVATISYLMQKKAKVVDAHREGHDLQYCIEPSDICMMRNMYGFSDTIKWMLEN